LQYWIVSRRVAQGIHPPSLIAPFRQLAQVSTLKITDWAVCDGKYARLPAFATYQSQLTSCCRCPFRLLQVQPFSLLNPQVLEPLCQLFVILRQSLEGKPANVDVELVPQSRTQPWHAQRVPHAGRR
ncbi:hypothetical protein CI238_10432, partial [Colletotrichum incanum]